ncbi:aldo/keto reductase [Pantoea cypripedii]|uniref:Aldo/keto reductase n=1 Tax=Pantoea cypripedii TaxID=55209 RepID=A0A1X1ER57_PANCY|nr:aldo/keto reductase [Pantoea cypripedii]MBP2196505.1 aryl-alcohol dehydrogenase-like predicted oxidoreductase [Pantoea cypripedii]ORM92489.1 aldo/keto reductase [Pantoea cypripedii]
MQQRQLGNQGLQVSALGPGCMGMSFAYGPNDEQQALNTLARAFELGVDFLDTAEVYGPFTNEILLAKALKGRKDIKVATKFGFRINEQGEGWERVTGANSDPAHIRRAVEGSLQRLGVESIDLLYQHRLDPAVPIEEVVGVMADLVREGKVKYLGLSEVSPATLRRACAVHPISALQSEYSLWTRDPEQEIFAVCRELNIGFVPYSPLGRGFLTGKFPAAATLAEDDFRRYLPRFQQDAQTHNQKLVNQLTELAAGYDATPAQLALAWVLAKGEFIVPIPGASKIAHLEQNCAAAALQLSSADISALDVLFDPQQIQGERYNASEFVLVDR